jgi:replicative DNA helicase
MEETLIRRIPPHSPEAEKSVIGAMLMSEDAALAASEILTKDDFYDRQNGIVFEAMRGLCEAGKAIDPVTLRDALNREDLPEEMRSMEFIRELLVSVQTSANVREYARIVREKATLRRMIRVSSDIENACYQGREDTETIMDQAEKNMFQVLQQRTADSFVPIRTVVYNTLEAISAASRSNNHVTGLETGFLDLDYKTSGFQNSDFILIAARPSMGKTALVLNIADYLTMRENRCVGIFSLEMSK